MVEIVGYANQIAADNRKPEEILAECFKKDLNVIINPQALRMFIRLRFDRLSCLSHKIHNGD